MPWGRGAGDRPKKCEFHLGGVEYVEGKVANARSRYILESWRRHERQTELAYTSPSLRWFFMGILMNYTQLLKYRV